MVRNITMATSNFGKLGEFNSNVEDWQSYVEEVELYFIANGIDDETKKTAILLSSCAIETFHVFKGLTAPNLPGSKAFNDLVKLMEDHENPRRNPIAERFKFNMRNRKADESVSAYVAELRRLIQYCEYGNSLDSMLRDRLVCGINHDRTQQRLLSEGVTLTLQKGLDISLSLESAIQQSAIMYNDLRPKQEVVAKVEKKPNS